MRQEDHPVLRAIQEIKKAVIGKDDCIVKVMTAILAGGHILIEDIPGVGKTTMALAFSRALSVGFQGERVLGGIPESSSPSFLKTVHLSFSYFFLSSSFEKSGTSYVFPPSHADLHASMPIADIAQAL